GRGRTMTLSDLAVRRPVLAAVAAIVLVVLGLVGFFALPVRELPNVDPPNVSISTSYRGASAQVVEERITQTIEAQVAGLQGLDRVTSTSRDGQSRINIAFTLDRNLDQAANDVRDAVSRVVSRLPVDADPPQVAKANADSQALVIVTMQSTTMNRLELTDYINRYLVQRFATVPGVATVQIQGAQNYAMRIWLNADQMAARGVTVDDITTALNSQNVELPAGSLESSSKDYTITVPRNFTNAADFANLPISTSRTTATGASSRPNGVTNSTGLVGGYVTRLGDIARIEEGPDERRRSFTVNGVDTVAIALTRQSQANDLDISKGAQKAVDEIAKSLPSGTTIKMSIDYTTFTSEAIKEVWITMGLSLAIVAAVNLLFLGSWRAAIIPSVVAPVCVISSFIVLAGLPFGFSVNLLTLLALVLAIGLVVDDAIVVVENIQRHIDEEGEPPLVAAERGAKQVFFAVIATTIVLMAVFAPLMVMPGYNGRLFVELAVAIASAVGFSAFLALSLSPMLASLLLRPAHTGNFLSRGVDWAVNKVRNSYRNSLGSLLGGGKLTAIGAAVLVLCLGGVTAGLFMKLPKELVPAEDRGRVDVSMTGPEGAGYDYSMRIAGQMTPEFKQLKDQGIVDLYAVGVPGFGGGSFNSATGNIALVSWKNRKVTAQDVAAQINRDLASITGARVTASVRSSLGRGGGTGVSLIAEGDDYPDIQAFVAPIMAAASNNPGLTRVQMDYQPTAPRLLVAMDQAKATAMNVSPQSIGRALQTMLGSSRVTTYLKNGQEYDVMLQADISERRTIGDLNGLYVRNGTGDLVPLASVVTTKLEGDAPSRARTDRQRSITMTAQLQPGYTMGDAITFLNGVIKQQPQTGVITTWGGASKDYLDASNSIVFAFGGALLLVFLALAGQFESWIHPAIIILTVPLALLGGLLGLLFAGSTVNTYSEIGLIILVGISAKNGILIVEFANQLRDAGKSVTEAVIESASVRLRPIVMTSIAAAFGALPLVFAHGPGAASRQTIGVVIFTGCIFSTLLTVFIVPVFYNLLAGFTKSPEWTARQIEAFEHGDSPHPAE
ncbi:MAG: multidrug transporter AcrB, partial [Caulobacteraceae bacterium]|nr:multidrug transporter AcrB [Caulobacteraceae bacterium]